MGSEIEKYFKASNTRGAIERLETKLTKQATSRFKGLIGHQFINTPESTVRSLNQFVKFCQGHFEPKAIYLEMNGFDINYDRWYFDFFGYAEYPRDPDDIEWLGGPSSEEWKRVTLRGLERTQQDF